MSYTALYRKWRPKRFADVKGQEAIVRTLKNQIMTGKVGHAYLFCGSRGTGKTTIAKIFAKAVNCENPEGGEPCGCCETCKAIDAGSSLNVFELDAASNNGVDEVRELINAVQYPPTVGTKSVYILDEVHMMSKNAFNAFLKTLEEPPEHAIFVLATTEPHKLLPTILSRCQEYDFHRIGSETIIERLKELCAGEGIQISDHALEYIARKADGGLRDAISLLDRAVASKDGELSYEDVLASLGAVDNEVFSRFTRLMINKDTPGLLALVDEAIMNGREITQFTSDLIWYFRNLLLVKTSTPDTPMVEVFEDDRRRLVEEAGLISTEEILRDIRIFSEALNRIKASVSKRVLFEVATIKAVKPELDEDNESVLARIGALEMGGVAVKQPAPVKVTAPVAAPEPKLEPIAEPEFEPVVEPEPVPTPAPEPTPAPTPAQGGIIASWDAIVSKITPMHKIAVMQATPVMEGETITLNFANKFAMDMAARDRLDEEIKAIIKADFGKDVNIIAKVGIAKEATQPSDKKKIVKEAFAGLDIEFEGEN